MDQINLFRKSGVLFFCLFFFALSGHGAESSHPKCDVLLRKLSPTDLSYLLANGYSSEVAQNIIRGVPEMLEAIKAAKSRGKAVTAYRGFQGSFLKYKPGYKKRTDGQVWFATQMVDPAGYANSQGTAKYDTDDFDGHPVDLPLGGYIIEYELPGFLTQHQDGEFGLSQSGPPKKGKSPRDRGEKGTWGFFDRNAVPIESPFIKYVYLPASAKFDRELVKVKGSGTFFLGVLRAKYYRVPYDQAFLNGKPISKAPRNTPIVSVKKYDQDPD